MAGHVLAKVTSKENSVDNVHIISSSFYGVCNSPANTANKEVIVANPNITNITLVKGMLLTIKFTFDNTVNNTSLTLFKNVGSEEIPLKNNNDTPLVSSIGVLTHEGENNTKVLWTAGSIVSFIYNGTNWIAMSSSNTARTDLSNVDNAWIQNGVIRNGVIGDAQIGGVSANKLTAGTIDASNIHVTNLRADNLIVTRMNGQPVIGGYTVVNSDAAGYEEMNPVERGWYEIQPNGTMVRTEDTEVDLNKVYYSSTSSSVALYDQNYINNMETELNNRIDGAIETFSGKEIPTEHNKPYTDWYDTTVSPVKDDRRAHVGDLYYIIGAYDEVESTIPGYINMSPVEQEWYEFDEINQTHILSEDTEVVENKTYYTPSLRNGYCYRFYEDSTTNAYSWVLIKDSDVTAALSSISELQNFNEQLSHWEEATDEGVISIRQKFTTLSGKVDNTITSAVQVWYTGTASPPSKPNQKITSTATTSSTWTTVIPDYNDNAPYYYYCWQYLRSDNTCTHSEVIYDKTTTENQQIARDAAATANGAISGVDVEYISITSNTTPPSQEDLNWHSTITAGDYGDGLYIWQRTKTTTRTSISYTQPVCISGRDGQGAYIYSLTCNPSVIVKDNNGNFSPTAVAFSATRAQGTNTPVAYEGRFIIQESEDGSNWTTVSNISDQTNTTSVTYNTPTSSSNIKLLKGTLYMGGTAAVTPVDIQTVPIVTDGQNGQEGHDAYTVLLTNESHTFAANTSNALTASVTSEVIAYKGATRVTASIGTIANTTTGVTAAIVNNTNNTISPQFSVSVGSAVTAPQGIITIPVQVDGHNFEKQFAWALAFKGSEGKGIKSVTEYYALNNSTTAPTGNHSTSPSVWSTAIKTPTKDNKYVWNYEVITYTDNTTATPTTKHIAATYGETGAAGKSISNIVDYYQTTTNTTAPSSIYESTTTPNGWSITVQNPTSTNKYLWNYEQISYTDGSTPATTDPRIIGVYGDSGISATKIEEEYIKTNSSTNTPSDNASGWSTTQPTWEPNYYIWTRSKITWSAPNPSMTTVTTPVLARGLNSANETAADAQAKANSALKSNIQLWTVNGGNGNTLNPGPSTPSAPTAVVTTTATTVTANSWTLAIPTYTPSLSYYYYCLQQERGDGQYQWTTPVYDPTTSDMMKTTSEIITFEQTTNKTITDTVSEQSSKITQLTNETKTIANPNLSPFFSHDLKDVYNSNSNPTGYWAASLSGALVRLEDGWAHFEPSNTVTSQTDYGFNVKPILNFGTIQQTVTILVELRNISWTGATAPKIYCPYSPGTTIINAANFNIASNTTQIERFKLTTKVGNNYSELFRGIIRLSANSFAQFDIRISLYEGDYNGPYKPYVDQIGLATLTNTVNEVKQTATANSSIISQLTRTVGVGPDGNPVETPSEDSLLYRAAALEQDLDGFRTTVTETYNKINSRGEQLVTNGNGLMGDNTNYTSLIFDGSKANGSPGSFTHIPQYYTCFPEEKFPIDPSSEYIVSCDAISADGTAKAYGCVYNYDIDGNTIEASHIGYVEGSLTTLARELKTGDTKVYLTDVSGFMTTTYASHQRSLRFWDYKNSYNYMYPPETYTRNVLPADSWASDSAIDRSANTITLKTAYSGPTHAVGTYVSEGLSGSTYLYFFGPSTIPTTWTNFNRLLSGTLSNGNPNTFAFRPGTAYCGVGFLWNYGMTSSSPQGQMWVTNISMMKSSPSSSEFKTAESKITQNANNIELKVSESDVTGNYLVGKINLSSTTATISADRVEINGTAIFNSISSNINNTIESKGYITTTAANNVVNEAINNLEIGGRNLLLWTKDLPKGSDNSVNGKDGIAAWGSTLSLLSETADGIKLTAANNPQECIGIPLANDGSVDNNEDVLLTFEARGNITNVGQFYWLQASGANVNITNWLNGQSTIALSETEWTKFTTNVKSSQANVRTCTRILMFYALGSANNGKWIEIRKGSVKLEKGTKPTDWTPAPEDVEASISNVENNAAPKASAVKRTQRIYYRTSSSMTSWTMPTTWLATTSDVFNQWTCKVPRMTANTDGTGTKYLYLYTCEQREMANGTLEYTTVLLDDSTTIIDGGTIITGSITANKLNAADINASNMLTVGSLKTALQNDITNGVTAYNRATAYRGVCSASTTTATKVVTCDNFPGLSQGIAITVYNTTAQTATAALSLKINNGDTKTIYVNGATTGNTNRLLWGPNSSVTYVYDGSYWRVADNPGGWYGSTCTATEATATKTTTVSQAVIFKGTAISVPMQNTNTNTAATLNIQYSSGNSLTNTSIYYGSTSTIPTSENGYAWLPQSELILTYDGQYWRTGHQTFINGGNILANSITAAQIDATNLHVTAANIDGTLTASQIDIRNSLTIGDFTIGARDLILNGVNLLRISELLTTEDGRPDLVDLVNGWISDSTPSGDSRTWNYANSNWQIYLSPGDYILSWEINKITTNSSRGLAIYPESGNAIWTSTGSNGPFNTIGTGNKTFSLTEDTSIGIMFKLYDGIVRFKLEKGTVATDWSLSPEDKDASLSSQFNETKTLIQNNLESIENVNNILQGGYVDPETDETVEGLITTVNGKLDAGYLKSWLYADENYLALGKTDLDTNETIVRAVLNSEALVFEKEGVPVATYGGEDGMNSPRAVIDDEFRVGNFMWVNKRSNHHVSFKYVGGTV